jgi:hypothetical protein
MLSCTRYLAKFRGKNVFLGILEQSRGLNKSKIFFFFLKPPTTYFMPKMGPHTIIHTKTSTCVTHTIRVELRWHYYEANPLIITATKFPNFT